MTNATMNTIKLREGINNMVVVGKLKSKEVKYGNASDGTPTISVNLKVLTTEKASETEEKVHENTIRLWAKQTSKLYTSYATVANEYRTIEVNGEENADIVRITGSLEMNEYVKDSELKTMNNLRGVFVNRVTDPTTAIQEVGAEAECVVLGNSDEIKDGKPTGRKKVQLMSVGYNSRIHEFQDVFVEANLANDFIKMYPTGSTAKFVFKVNRYAVAKKEETPAASMALGFGSGLSNTFGGVTTDYVNNIIIVGGTAPYVEGVKYSNEQIAEIKKLREMARNEKLNSAPAAPAVTNQTGFGTGFGDMSGFGAAPTQSSAPTEAPATIPSMEDMPF